MALKIRLARLEKLHAVYSQTHKPSQNHFYWANGSIYIGSTQNFSDRRKADMAM